MRHPPLRAWLPVLILLSLATALAVDAAATQVVRQSTDEMGRAADLIVRGRVQGVRSYWNETRTRILTEATVAVDSRLKGRSGGAVRVVQMGGTVGTVKMTVAGALDWRPGEDVLLFLEHSLPDRYRVSGFTQGKFTVETDPASGVAYARQAGLAGVGQVGDGAAREASGGRLRLDDLLATIRPHIEEGR